MMSEFDLELIKLKKVYPGGNTAVEAFDLKVEPGEFISFVGPSGCGKTTTLRMIAGLEDITEGQLRIKGTDYTHVQAEQRPTSTIFQNYAIFPHMTVRQNIEFALKVRGFSAAETRQRSGDILEKLQLTDVAGDKEGSLSGGQKQRVALARGLVVEPQILLLDEPLGALDANLRKSIQEEIKLLQKSLGITFIFVTHAQSEALSMGDRVVVMNAGRVEQIASPQDLYMRPQTSFVARFIGRNTLFSGKVLGRDGRFDIVETKRGPLRGIRCAQTKNSEFTGDANLVVPSEFIQVHPGRKKSTEWYGMDVVTGRLQTLAQIGSSASASIVLDDGREMRLETIQKNVEGKGLEPGALVSLVWHPQCATVLAN